MSYEEFLKHSCNLDGDWNEQIGMSKDSAYRRYEEFLKLLKRFRPSSVIDFGAGNGSFWQFTHDKLGYKLKTLSLIEKIDDPRYVNPLLERTRNVALNVNLYKSLSQIKYTRHDMLISIGALNYQGLNGFVRTLNSIWNAKVDVITFETNIQSPHTSSAPGVWNPSINLVYEWLYDKYLHKGGMTKVEIVIIKKYTAIFVVDRRIK